VIDYVSSNLVLALTDARSVDHTTR
jgi:hypothetical protein